MKDYFGYHGKTCVVTGAASGIARAVGEMLIDLGANVYGLDVNEVKTPGVRYVNVDLSEKESIDRAFVQIPPRFEKFFGCAGLSGMKTDFLKTFKTNFIANKYITDKYVNERMDGGGAIAYISSNGGLNWEKYINEYAVIADAKGYDAMIAMLMAIKPERYPGPLGYALSKRALNYYAFKNVAHFAAKGIRINVVMPGSTQTGLTDDFAKMVGGMDKLLANATGLAHRMAEPQEMAAPLVFLNSDLASYITGNAIIGDYGTWALTMTGDAPDPMNRKLLF